MEPPRELRVPFALTLVLRDVRRLLLLSSAADDGTATHGGKQSTSSLVDDTEYNNHSNPLFFIQKTSYKQDQS